ncbi:hypothetical protein [Microbacterium sp.]|uniref:hypothetical protein n=1 Tax=Microbacterium sp. TaxID=51671 RepID=UPI0039E4884A
MSEVEANFDDQEVIMVPIVDSPPVLPTELGGARLLPVGPDRWRVLRPNGLAAGHLERHDDGTRTRYRAWRFQASTGAFREVGEFWSPEEAVECLRLSR